MDTINKLFCTRLNVYVLSPNDFEFGLEKKKRAKKIHNTSTVGEYMLRENFRLYKI